MHSIAIRIISFLKVFFSLLDCGFACRSLSRAESAARMQSRDRSAQCVNRDRNSDSATARRIVIHYVVACYDPVEVEGLP